MRLSSCTNVHSEANHSFHFRTDIWAFKSLTDRLKTRAVCLSPLSLQLAGAESTAPALDQVNLKGFVPIVTEQNTLPAVVREEITGSLSIVSVVSASEPPAPTLLLAQKAALVGDSLELPGRALLSNVRLVPSNLSLFAPWLTRVGPALPWRISRVSQAPPRRACFR